MEDSQNFARESTEGIKDHWVGSRRRGEFVGEGGVNKVDEEHVRKEGDCLIVCVRGRYVIWMMRQGIRGTEVLARNMLEGEIEFRQVE